MNMRVDTSLEEGRGETPKTYVAFVLDRSGSMNAVLTPTIDGFNHQLDTIKREANINTLISLVTFNDIVTPIFFNRPVSGMKYLNSVNYRPHGWTALYDAVGYTIRRLENEAEYDSNTAFLVVIVSDGQENRSLEFNANSLSSLIRQKKNTGRWTFTYIGSNQDLEFVRNVLYIPQGNIFDWTYTAEGTAAAYGANSIGLSNYLISRNAGETTTSNFYTESTTTKIRDSGTGG